MIRKVLFILCLLVFFGFSKCSSDFKTNRYERILCSSHWIINTYVDNSENIVLDVSDIVYIFCCSGELTKVFEDGEKAHSTWELIGDNEYLRFGNNTFKLQTITRRLISLRYGEVDIFLISL